MVSDKQREKDFQAQNDLSTLREAQSIKGDKGRMTSAMSMAKKELAAINKVKNGANTDD